MKKIKIMLLALLVFAAVGGALAFKAVKGSQTLYVRQGNTCPAIEDIIVTTLPLEGYTPVSNATTIPPASTTDCSSDFFYTTEGN